MSHATRPERSRAGRWLPWIGLFVILGANAWLRGHAFGPAIRDLTGVDAYPVTSAESEPLDCDEAIYGYIGKRLVGGSVMYLDLTENKPPGGYWLYAAAVALGGPTELTIRLLPLPFVLATTVLVFGVARRLRGTGTGLLAAALFAMTSSDAFLYGESANMEHMINFFSFAALALLLSGRGSGGWKAIAAAGACLASAALIKQTSLLNLPLFAAGLWLGRTEENAGRPRRLADLAALVVGCLAPIALAALILVAQGAGPQAYEDIVRYGRALATETPPAPNAPPLLLRWVTGNADPQGGLPWPFGTSTYLVWWGTGTWPFWLAAIPGLASLGFRRDTTADRRLVVAWTLSAWVQVALPRLFWQHYYLLPLPGLAVVVAVFLGDQIAAARARRGRRVLHGLIAAALVLAIGATARLQAIEYLGVPPEGLVKDRGGPQWLANRALGREIARRTRGWDRPTLFVWGWQGPLYFYSGLDGVTPQVFVDDFLKAFAGTGHPQARPRIDRMLRDLEADPPTLIFAGYPPFPALKAFLDSRYYPSRVSPGLWVERSAFGRFEGAGPPGTAR